MKNVHLIARFKIREGKLNSFLQIKDECIALTKNESGAMVYQWFLDEANSQCTVLETYKDSEAVMAHMGNVGPSLSKLTEISDFSGEVFGNASEELKAAIGPMGIVPVPYIGGYK